MVADKSRYRFPAWGSGGGCAAPDNKFLVLCWRLRRQHSTKKEHEEGLYPSLLTLVSLVVGGGIATPRPHH